MTKVFSRGSNNTANPGDLYKYSGKELDQEVMAGGNLDWYYFGARYYDPEIGRWHVVDPLSYKYPHLNPYNYCLNNPLSHVDFDGRDGGATGLLIGGTLELLTFAALTTTTIAMINDLQNDQPMGATLVSIIEVTGELINNVINDPTTDATEVESENTLSPDMGGELEIETTTVVTDALSISISNSDDISENDVVLPLGEIPLGALWLPVKDKETGEVISGKIIGEASPRGTAISDLANKDPKAPGMQQNKTKEDKIPDEKR